MLPLLGSGSFSTDHVIDWSVKYYDSSMTVPETGIGFRLGTPSSSFTTAGMQGAGDSSTYISSNATAVLTDWTTYGRTASVIGYWGAGAPAGITKSRYVVYHYRGYLATTANRAWIHTFDKGSSFWLAFSGKGYIKVVAGGSTVLNSKLEPKSYVYTSLLSSADSTQFDIYYWQLGEEWGGLTGKYVPQNIGQTLSSTVTNSQLREAPVISASILPYSTATAVTLPHVLEASVETSSPNDVSSATFTVALKDNQATSGWSLLESPRRLYYVGPGGSPTYTVKRRQLIEVNGGFLNEQYQRFEGFIDSIEENDGIVTVKCLDHSGRLAKINTTNYPDRISYANYMYVKESSTSEPIYNITAYDAWPLENAIEDLCLRGGIDSKLLHFTRQTNNVNGTVTDIDSEVKAKHYYLRAKAIDGTLITLPKPRKYGNAGAGFSSEKPNDDEYAFKPEVSSSLLDTCKKLADALGYDFRVNALGAVVLSSRNNPHRYTKVNVAGGTTVVHPSALDGYYKEFTGTFNSSNTVKAARVDLVVGRKDTLGIVNYSVHIMSGAQVASGTINTALSTETNGIHYYDNRFTTTGSNQCVFKLYTGKWGQYEVRTSRNAGTNWLDSILIYDYDAQKTQLPETLLTDKTVESLSTSSRSNEIVNQVIVVGKRKTALTDSTKTSRNVNNPETEYFVAAGTDPSAIWDPASTNYAGGAIGALIVDNKISDQDYANWVAQTLLTRQRDPAPSADITVPCLPSIEPRDPILVSDEAHDSISSSSMQWVVGIRESYSLTSMKMSLSTTAYPEIPSYEPRRDLSIATIDSTYGGQPAINVSITYPSLDSGTTITNPTNNLSDARSWGYVGSGISNYILNTKATIASATDGNGKYLQLTSAHPWPPIPDSISFGWTDNSVWGTMKNNPYFKFWHIYDYTTKKIHIPCLTGDQTTNYSNSATGFYSWSLGVSSIPIAYQGIDPAISVSTIYSGKSPFFDPYMSELPDGNLIKVSFDMLISGYYRVSVWDARDRKNPTLVAWLTEAGQEDVNEEKHWTYFSAGKSREFLWDGVDNVGQWNQKQSTEYSMRARGWFEKDQNPLIGKGFYVWNDLSTPIIAISGQTTSGKLTFNPDHFSQFYVKIEVTNDALVDYATTNGTASVRTINSFDLKNAPTQNPKSEIYIYTHLPPPNKVIIKTIEDWDPATKTYDHSTDAYGTTGWVTTGGDSAGSFTNTKPFRLTLEAVARPGVRFAGNKLYTNVKVHRIAHLGYHVMDQFVTYMGEAWHQNTTVEKKRLTSRRMWVSDKTIDYADTDFRSGDTLDLSTNKWVFRPKDFTIDNNGVEEPIDYCNYLQLEEVPDFSVNRGLGEKRSRFILAYMGYVFYLSAYVQDRSGRMTWVIDNTFVDKAKILQNTFSTDFPEDLDNYSTRTIVARQWVDTQYRSDLITKWNIPATNPQNYVQFYVHRLEPHDSDGSSPLRIDVNGNNVNGSLTTGYNDEYSIDQKITGDVGSAADTMTKAFRVLPAGYLTNRQLGDRTTVNFFGDWTWEGNTTLNIAVPHELLWVPDLTRDFHPYYMIPPMPYFNNASLVRAQGFIWNYCYLGTNPSGDDRILNLAGYEVWQSKQKTLNEGTEIANNNMWFREPVVWETFMNANTTMKHTSFNYTRQDDMIHWEEFRGTACAGANPDRQSILVQPTGGAYLINTHRYGNLLRQPLVQNVNDDGRDVMRRGDVEYSARILTNLTGGATSDRGLFSITFRTKYNWHSSSFFPVDVSYRIVPRHLYPKYTVVNHGIPAYFDDGAWVGWKDDLATGSNLNWSDKVLGDSFIVGSGTSPGGPPHNIFDPRGSVNVYGLPFVRTRWTIALGPRLTESKDLIVSLSLVNSRRAVPVPGK